MAFRALVSRAQRTFKISLLCLAATTAMVMAEKPAFAAASSQFASGIESYKAGDYKKALAIFDGIVDSNPTDGDAHFWRANCLSKVSRMKDAVAEFKLAYLLSKDQAVKDYSKTVLKQYGALPKLASIDSVKTPARKPEPENKSSSPNTFKLKTEQLDWNVKFTDSFKASLKADHDRLDNLVARADRFNSAPNPLQFGNNNALDLFSGLAAHNNTPLDSVETSAISNYSIVLVLDQSSSMDIADCPAPLPGGQIGLTSRFSWCAGELQNFSNQAATCFANGFTLITFNDNYRTYTGCKPYDLSRILQQNQPQGGTDLDKAIAAAFTQRQPQGKKLAIIVITDGCPSNQKAVTDTIVRAVNTHHINEFAVLFLTIGLDKSGEEYLDFLDNDLKSNGASYDAVSTVPYVNLVKTGLAKSLARAVLTK